MAVVKSKVNVPCCSRLGELPTSVPPGGSALIPAFLKVGRVADQKRVRFDVETDAPADPIVSFTLLARFVPEWEVRETSGPAAPLLIGRASSRTYRLIAMTDDIRLASDPLKDGTPFWLSVHARHRTFQADR